MQFSKDLLGSDLLHVHKISASYYELFRPLVGVTCPCQKFCFLGFLLAKNVKTLFSTTAKSIYTSFIYQRKAYNDECLLGVLTFDGLGVTQSQGQMCKIFTV